MLKKIFLSFFLPQILFIRLFTFTDESIDLLRDEIDHIVILMLENRSFDNVLAWLYENDHPHQFIPSDTFPEYLGLKENILNLYTNDLVNSIGNVVFSCAPIKGIPSVEKSGFFNSPIFDPHESFPHVNTQIGLNKQGMPTMKGFLQDYATLWDEKEWLKQKKHVCAVMETYTSKEMPVMYGLAKHYAISDYWFSSVPTQTNPNRAFAFCGTSEGEVVNGPLGKSLFHTDTVWNRLYEESKDSTWTLFWQGDMIPLLFPGPLNGTNLFASLNKIPEVENHFVKFDYFHELARRGKLPNISYIEPLWTLSANMSAENAKILEELNSDSILGLQGNDMHPPGEVRSCENLLANVYTSLISNPKTWERTLLVITFDEHGGLFDHVPPPSAIAPDDNFQNGFKFDRYGVRVATLLISPKIEKSVVIRSENPEIPFDHTSIISTLLKWKEIEKSKWNLGKRVDIAPTFDCVISRHSPRKDYVLVEDGLLPAIDESQVVHMGEKFYLKDQDGCYLTESKFFGNGNKLILEFGNGPGKAMHGSFTLIKNSSKKNEEQFLDASFDDWKCSFCDNNHHPSQWWTIKKVDNSFVGLDVQYGDRIYLENHVYLDVFKYVPARLYYVSGLFGKHLSTKSIHESGCDDCYWIIERVNL